MFTQAHISMDRIEEMMAKQKFASSTTLYNEQFSLDDLYIFEYRTHYEHFCTWEIVYKCRNIRTLCNI